MSFYKIEPSCQITGLNEIFQGLFGQRTQGTFVEVGAYDGRTYSNTYGLAELGWTGLYIEPVDDLYQRCLGNHAAHPNVRVIKALIGKPRVKRTVYKQGNDMFSISVQGMRAAGGTFSAYTELPTVALDEILLPWEPIKHQPLDLLSIDVEGAELEVLNTFSIDRWHPKAIIIEAHEYHEKPAMRFQAEAINAFMRTAGYIRIYADGINNIYVDRQ